MAKLVGVKVSRYEQERAKNHVDPDGKFPYLSDIMTAALAEFNDKLEEEENTK